MDGQSFTCSEDRNALLLRDVFPRARFSDYRRALYATDRSLFSTPEKVSDEEFAEAFRQRLKTKAGFAFVPKPMPMKPKSNSTIYCLYFASPKAVASGIVRDVFAKYQRPFRTMSC